VFSQRDVQQVGEYIVIDFGGSAARERKTQRSKFNRHEAASEHTAF